MKNEFDFSFSKNKKMFMRISIAILLTFVLEASMVFSVLAVSGDYSAQDFEYTMSGDPVSDHPASGDPTQHPASGDPTQHPASGDPTQHPASGDPTQHPASGDPTQHPASGDPIPHPASGDPIPHPASGDPIPHPASGDPISESDLAITEQPVSQNQVAGKKVSFSVTAEGNGLTYQWEYLRPWSTRWMKSGLSSAKTSTLSFTMSSAYDGIMFRCVVSNDSGKSITSYIVNAILFEIIGQPESVEQAEGTPVSLSVSATGTDLSYEWQYLKKGASTWKKSTASGCATDTVTFKMASAHDGMQFRCVVTDDNGLSVTSDSAYLSVIQVPVIDVQPQSQESVLGVPVMVSVSARGNGLTYQWQYLRPGKTSWVNSGLSTATSSTLKFTMSTGYNGMKFRCIIQNDQGNSVISDEALITALLGPGIVKQPTDVYASTGTAVIISTLASGTDVDYCWEFQKPGTSTWRKSGLSSATSPDLSFKMSSGYDGIKFRCRIKDANGNEAVTDIVTVTMATGPAITVQPKDAVCAIGTKATFSIRATGDELSYQWQYQKPGKTTWTNSGSSGNKTNTVKVGATTGTNNMKFRCVVTDKNGNVAVSNSAVLTAN